MMLEFDQVFDLVWRQLWQVTVVAAIGMALMRWACRGRPHLAYLLGLVVLAKCWTPPIWSSYGGVFCWPPRFNTATRSHAEHEDQQPQAKRPMPAAIVAAPRRDIGIDFDSRLSPPAPAAEAFAAPSAGLVTAFALYTIWLSGAAGLLGAASAGWWRWRRRLCPSTAPIAELESAAQEVAAQVGLRRVPRVLLTASSGPAVLGLLRPTIVLPERLLAADNADNLKMVLAHEMVHHRRGDLYVGLFQFVTQMVWWFHPLVWATCRRVTRERERSCDEAVLAILRCAPGAYAQCLLDVLRWKRQTPALVPFPAIRALDVTQRRLEHILQTGAARRGTPRRYLLLAAAVSCMVLPGERLAVVISKAAPPPTNESAKSAVPGSPENQPAGASGKPVKDNAAPKVTEARQATGKEADDDEKPAQAAVEQKPRLSKVDEAIDRGVRYLKIEQRADGSWPDPVGYPGGITGLCTLALLKWGVKPEERTAQSALDYLRHFKPSMTYTTALQTLVFCNADSQADGKIIQRNVNWLAANQKLNGPMAGAWGYPVADGDNSNTGFAIWALYAAEQAGMHVEKPVWKRNLDHWINTQNTNGSWGYKPQLAGTGSMTSQGLFCVAAAAKVLGEDKPDQPAAQSIAKGTQWLTRNFSAQVNPGMHGQQSWLFYYSLAYGKAAWILDKDKFGEHDWHAEGCKALLDMQRPDGSWKGTGHAEDDPDLATSLALLFLLQGR